MTDKYRVLLVDDEPLILRALSRLLRCDSYDTLTASSGQEALEIIRGTPVQLLITDNIMPGMTGVELIRQVKQCSPDTIRIILSGQADMESVLKAINEGEAYRFVLKPWHDVDLQITVNIALAQYKLNEDVKMLREQLRAKTAIIESLRARHPEIFREMDDASRQQGKEVPWM